jgi:hypothetical protein
VGNGCVDVLHAERDMVQAGPAPVDEPGDRRLGGGRLEQFERRGSHVQEARADVLRSHVLGRRHLEPQHVAEESQRRRQIAHRDADMIDPHFHRSVRPRMVVTAE